MINGYVKIMINGVRYPAHRLAFLYVTGEFPPHEVDHVNGVRDDNKWTNLRHATRGMNSENIRRPNANNTSGYLGISIHTNQWNGGEKTKWQAKITVSGKTIYLGSFDTPEQANSAYVLAKRKLHAGCTL